MREPGEEMKAIVVMIALLGTPAAAVAHPHISEPTLMVMSGASLLGLASLLRRRSATEL
jgi:hypothetical protein